MAKVRVIAPDGRAGSIEDSELEAAQAAGYKLETEKDVKKRGYEKQGLRTAAEGAARSVTFGLSDPFMKGYGVPAEDIAGRREANPGAALIGEIGGAALPIGAGPLAAKAGLAVERAVAGTAPTALRTLGAKAAGGATGGGLWGLGSAISEDALQDGDRQLAGEKLLAMGGGGVVGAGLGVIEGALGMAGKAAVNKIAGQSLRNKLSEFSEEVMVRQIAQQSDFKKMNLFDRRRDVGRYAIDKGWAKEAALGGVEALHSAAAADSEQIGQQMSGVLRQADARVHGVDTARILVRAQNEVLQAIEKDPLMKQSYNAVRNYVDELQTRPYSFEELWGLQSNLRKKVGPTEPTVFKESLWKLRKIIRDELIDQAEEISPHFGVQLKKLNKDYGLSEQIEQLAEKRLIQQEGNRYVGASDYLAGGAAAIAGATTAGPAGVLAGGVAALANKLARERGGFAIAEIGDRLAKSQVISNMANTFKRRVETMLRESPELLGAYRVPLEQAAARGAMDLVGTHIQLMQHDPEYAGYVGVVDESPELTGEYLQKGEKLSSLGGMMSGFDAQADGAMDRFLGRAAGRPGAPKQAKRSLKDFNERITTLTDLTQRGGAHLPSLDGVAPETSMMLQVASLNAANFLLEKAPKNPFAGQMAALSKPWSPSEASLSKWYRFVEAIERPQHVLEELAGGSVMPEHVEAMAAVYPKLLEDLRQRMLSRMTELEDTLPYSKRLALSGFLGTDILGLSSQQLALLQGLHHAAQSPKMAAGGARPDGRQEVNQEKNLETQAQRMEKRA